MANEVKLSRLRRRCARTRRSSCPTCGAAPIHADGDKRAQEEEVRSEDLEPYVTLRYIARLFKVLAVLMVVMLIGEVVTGIVTEGQARAADATRRGNASARACRTDVGRRRHRRCF